MTSELECLLTYCLSTVRTQTLKASANGPQKTLNKYETQNEIVLHIRQRHPETINSISLNSVSRIGQTDVRPVLHLEVSCFGIALTVNKTSSKH